MAGRFCGEGEPYEGLITIGAKGRRWNGKTKFVVEKLDQPLRWTKPRMVFVNSMSDLFHESLSNEQIAAVFGVMAAAPTHTFQVLTKRPKRMLEWFKWAEDGGVLSPGEPLKRIRRALFLGAGHEAMIDHIGRTVELEGEDYDLKRVFPESTWPLPNVWIGVSVEDQKTAEERIPLLLQAPASVRWISLEPQLGPVALHERWKLGAFDRCPIDGVRASDLPSDLEDGCEGCAGWGEECAAIRGPKLDWVVLGGESGPGARPFEIDWARNTIRDCQDHGVPVFMKQFGSNPKVSSGGRLSLADRKGGNMSEWPRWARVREWPE